MSRRSAWVLGALCAGAVVAGAAIAACGAAPQKSMSTGGAAPSDAQGADDPLMGMDRRARLDEISDLHVQITAQLAEIGLFAEDPAYSEPAPPLPMASAIDSCGVAPTGAQCGDVCTIADSICDNARRICELADELPGDAWAAERCDNGKVSCARAHLRCCGC